MFFILWNDGKKKHTHNRSFSFCGQTERTISFLLHVLQTISNLLTEHAILQLQLVFGFLFALHDLSLFVFFVFSSTVCLLKRKLTKLKAKERKSFSHTNFVLRKMVVIFK